MPSMRGSQSMLPTEKGGRNEVAKNHESKQGANQVYASRPMLPSLYGKPGIAGALSPPPILPQDKPGGCVETPPDNLTPVDAQSTPISPSLSPASPKNDENDNGNGWTEVRYRKRPVPNYPRQGGEPTASNIRKAPVVPQASDWRVRCNSQQISATKKLKKSKSLPPDPGACSVDTSGSARGTPKDLEALKLGDKCSQTIKMAEMRRILVELGIKIVNGKGAQFKCEPTLFGKGQRNLTFHQVQDLGHLNMVHKGVSFRKAYPRVITLMRQIWGV